jgi:hypothetical protein
MLLPLSLGLDQKSRRVGQYLTRFSTMTITLDRPSAAAKTPHSLIDNFSAISRDFKTHPSP